LPKLIISFFFFYHFNRIQGFIMSFKVYDRVARVNNFSNLYASYLAFDMMNRYLSEDYIIFGFKLFVSYFWHNLLC